MFSKFQKQTQIDELIKRERERRNGRASAITGMITG